MNKRILTLLVPACCALLAPHAAAASLPTGLADNDTLIVNYPRRVTVISGDSLQTVRIEGRHDDYDFHYENTIQLVDSNYVSQVDINSDRWDLSLNPFRRDKDRQHENVVTSNFGFGWCYGLNAPDNMDVQMGASCELFWTIAQWNYTPQGRRHTFSVGAGLDWRNYRMNGHWRFDKLADDRVVITPYPSEDVSKQFSRVQVLSFQFPMLYRYRFGRYFALSAGPMLNLNLRSSIKTRYRLDGEKHKETANNVHANPLTVDLMGIVKTPAFSLYVKYSPCHVLKTPDAPKFQSLSIGFYL